MNAFHFWQLIKDAKVRHFFPGHMQNTDDILGVSHNLIQQHRCTIVVSGKASRTFNTLEADELEQQKTKSGSAIVIQQQ